MTQTPAIEAAVHSCRRAAYWLLLVLSFCPPVAGRALADPIGVPRRIVSLAPSITEILFGIGAGPKLVGVSRYCVFPPEVARIEKVGGYIDPNIEAIVRLEPDVVLLLSEQGAAQRSLERLGLPVLRLSHERVSEVLDSITILGKSVGEVERAAALRRELEEAIAKVRASHTGALRPRAAVSIGGHEDASGIERLAIAGPQTFFDDLLSIAGADNAVGTRTSPFVHLSLEGVSALAPDIIFDLVPSVDERNAQRKIEEHWKAARPLLAKPDVQVVVLTDEFVLNPGPRFIRLLERMSTAVSKFELNRK